MAILDSVNELAKRFGVETEEQTISEQIDAINQKLDESYTGSRDIEESVSQFAKNDGPDARLGAKTITENGTYTALDDDLDGYSSVTVNVAAPTPETFEVVFSSPDFVEWTANKSYAETLSAIENGDNVLFKFVAYGESADSTGYYLFVEENHPENDKIIMIAMSSAYTSNRMSTMFLKWTINDEIAMVQLDEQS